MGRQVEMSLTITGMHVQLRTNKSTYVPLEMLCFLHRYNNHKPRKILLVFFYYFFLSSPHSAQNISPLNTELNPTCHLLALLGAHHILHISRIRFKTTYKLTPPHPLSYPDKIWIAQVTVNRINDNRMVYYTACRIPSRIRRFGSTPEKSRNQPITLSDAISHKSYYFSNTPTRKPPNLYLHQVLLLERRPSGYVTSTNLNNQ